MPNCGRVGSTPSFKGIYEESFPHKKNLKLALEEGKSQGIYNDSTAKELKEFQNTLKDMVENQAPKKDMALLTVSRLQDQEPLEPLGIQVAYRSHSLNKKEKQGFTLLCQNGLKQILDNKDLFFDVVREKIRLSKEAE